MDIIVVGQQAFDIEIGSNCKNIALEFSNSHRVLYVNPPLDRITVLRNKKEESINLRLQFIAANKTLHQIKHNLWNLYPNEIIESINWIKFDFIYNFFNKLNNRRFARTIRKAISQLDFKDYILFNDSDMFRSFYLKELINPKLTVYYSRDYLLATDYYKYHGEKLEPLIINKSNLCVANSQLLTEYCKQYNPNSYNVGQGCDISLFKEGRSLPIPSDVKNITGPIIGYVGALTTSRLDIEILSFIAKNKSCWQIILVGNEDNDFLNSELHGFKNVHFLGPKRPEDLPAYINSFDVCLNPQILNPFTNGNYPRKMDEYLAMGKPVVATKTDAISAFQDHIYMAINKNDYLTLIQKALDDDNKILQKNRQDFVSEHTWKNNVKEIYDAIVQSNDVKFKNNVN